MLSILVATRNRPQLLEGLLQSIEAQELIPHEVIIVDASDVYQEVDPQMYQFNLKHVRSADASISRQRNFGLSLVSKDTVYLAILDDDTYPNPDYLKKIVLFLQSNTNAVGASGVTSDAFTLPARRSWISFLKRLFFLDSSQSGIITKGAVNIGLREIADHPIKCEWLIGCSVFKLKRIGNLQYESSLDGYSLGEDVIFSFKASELGDLFVLPNVKLPHLQYSEISHYKSQYWFKWSSYRKTLVELLPGKYLKWMFYWWSNLGQVLIVLCSRRGLSMRIRVSSAFALLKGSLNG